jgi:hypothetical protein
MIVRRRQLSEQVLAAADAVHEGLAEAIIASESDRVDRQFYDWLSLSETPPSEPVLRWAAYRLADAPYTEVLAWVRELCEDVPTDTLPADLAWAVNSYLAQEQASIDDASVWSVKEACSIAHALLPASIEIARQLQPAIDELDERLQAIGCAKRRIPIIVAPLPSDLCKRWSEWHLSSYGWGGTCDDNIALVHTDLRQSLDSPELRHTLVHEMIHTTQELVHAWPDHSHLIEGVTEHIVHRLGLRERESYPAEYRLVEALGWTEDEIVRASNDMSSRGLWASRHSPDAFITYMFDRQARFSEYCHQPQFVEMLTQPVNWRFDERSSLQALNAQIARHLGLGEGSLRAQQIAVVIWACHVMEEDARRAVRWAISKHEAEAEIHSIMQWHRDEAGLAWMREAEQYGSWRRAAWEAVEMPTAAELLAGAGPSIAA